MAVALPQYLTTRDVAERLHVTPIRVRQFIADGRLPAVRNGRDWLIKEADVARVVHRRGTGRPPAP